MREPQASPWVVCSVMESDAQETLRQIAGAPAGSGIVEVRADALGAADVPRVVAESERPLIVTLRRREDGGGFDGDETTRVACLAAALDAGAAYVDVEWQSAAETLASGDRAHHVILSRHGVACDGPSLRAVHREMARSPAALLKIVAAAERPGDAAAVRALLADAGRAEPGRLACFALGRAGAITRVLAPSWGSWATYGAARPDRPTAEGQFSARDLAEVYGVLGIGSSTRRFALIGSRVFGSPSPAMHAAGYAALGLDARYIPVELDTLDEALPLVGEDAAAVGVEGFEALAVTMPFKQQAAARARCGDAISAASGAVNTVVVDGEGWTGYNTDGPAAIRLIGERWRGVGHGGDGMAGVELAIVGAGGTGKAIAAAALQEGARVTLFNRSAARGRAAADAVGARFAALDRLGSAPWDVLVNATPLGGGGETIVDPGALRGKLVLDAVYGHRPTPLVADARARGLSTIEGFDLLVEQAVLQFNRMTGRTADRQVFYDAGRRWLRAHPIYRMGE